jgi:DNA-binding Lrp family transcriptional regulator
VTAHQTWWRKGAAVSVRAYVLIQTEVGRASEVADEVRQIEGVSSADGVTGPHDVIARAAADSIDELGHLVVSRIQSVDGVTRTLTCPIVVL